MRSSSKILLIKLALSLLILISNTVSANDLVNTYLLRSYQNILEGGQEPSSHLSMSNWDTWVRDSEVRVSDNDISNTESQSYAFRVNIKNKKQVNAEQKLLKLVSQRGTIENSILHLDQVKGCYIDAINLLKINHKISILKQQRGVAQQELSAYSQLVVSDGLNPSKLQQTDINTDQLALEIRRYEQTLSTLLNTMEISTELRNVTKLIEGFNKKLITIEEILKKVNQESILLKNPSLEKLKLAKDINKQQVNREKADSSSAVSLLELEYDTDKNTYGATVGIRIPIGKDSFDTLMRKNSYQQAQLAHDAKLLAIKEDLDESILLISDYSNEYQLTRTSLASINQRLERILNTGETELILSLKKEKLDRQIYQKEIYFNILNEYINYLSLSGNLIEVPYRNWIQTGTPMIRG